MLRVVIAEVPSQREKVQKLCDFCRKLDGTEIEVIPIPPAIVNLGYTTKGTCDVFRYVANHCRGTPFLLLETDSIPLRAGWLEAISTEYYKYGYRAKAFMLPDLSASSQYDKASGIGVYPDNMAERFPAVITYGSFDSWVYGNCYDQSHFTRLIQHSYAPFNAQGIATRRHEFPRDADILWPDAVLFHSNPDQTLMNPGASDPGKIFYSSGDFGDIVAAMAVIRQMGGGRLMLSTHHREQCGSFGPREGITQERFAFSQSFWELQPYIYRADWTQLPPSPDMVDLASFRKVPWNRRRNLAEWQALHVGIAELDQTPWLTAPEAKHDRILIHRTQRFHNPLFPWRQVLDKYSDRVSFIGTKDEQTLFNQEFGRRIPRIHTPTLLEFASLINGAELGFYNSSVGFWIAAALGKKCAQETFSAELNAIVNRDNIWYTRGKSDIDRLTRDLL